MPIVVGTGGNERKGDEMPKQERFKTDYPGVFFIEGTRIGTDEPERIYYISYRKGGKKIEEKAGRQFQDDMTPARASRIRARKIDGDALTNQEQRDTEKAKEEAEKGRWTVDRLWEEYKQGRVKNKALVTDRSRYNLYLKKAFGHKEPREILALDVERVKRDLSKKKAPQTVLSTLNLLTWIVNFGVKNGLCVGLSFKVNKPEVHNEKTEDLTHDQLSRLLKAIEENQHPLAGNMMKLALFTGMRRGELFKLQWEHVDFERGFIAIVDPKGKVPQKIPLNNAARDLLQKHPRTEGSPFVFPGRFGEMTNIRQAVNAIKDKAKLPKDFRALHGLRHTYASALASSGKVDLYTLQKLMTHKTPRMTQRYAHLRDEALKAASNLAGELFQPAEKKEPSKVISLVKNS